jgi:hypothetical protein
MSVLVDGFVDDILGDDLATIAGDDTGDVLQQQVDGC